MVLTQKQSEAMVRFYQDKNFDVDAIDNFLTMANSLEEIRYFNIPLLSAALILINNVTMKYGAIPLDNGIPRISKMLVDENLGILNYFNDQTEEAKRARLSDIIRYCNFIIAGTPRQA